MPTPSQENDSKHASNKTIQDNLAPPEADAANSSKNQRRSNATTIKHKKEKNIIVEVVSIPKIDDTEANKIAKRANKISFWSNVVSLMLFLVTVILAEVAINQYHSSQTAATTAQKTFEETKRYDSISLKRQQAAMDSNFKRDTAALGIQKRALKETQKDFQISNAAYLEAEIINPKISPDEPINGDLIIRNLGAYPAKIINIRLSCEIGKHIPDFFVRNSKVIMKGNNYVIKDSPIGFPLNDISSNLPQEIYNGITKGEYKFYIEGYIVYKNLVTNSKRSYSFIIEIAIKKGSKLAFILNENEDMRTIGVN